MTSIDVTYAGTGPMGDYYASSVTVDGKALYAQVGALSRVGRQTPRRWITGGATT